MLESLDLHRSIIDLCRGFVVIDNGGNVDMVHQTAREYLLSSDDHPFHINQSAAHQQLFSSSMRCLMATGLRAKLNRNDKPDFLDYSASLWSSHLISTPLECVQTFGVLKKFLTGRWILTWIQVLAACTRLRVLIQTSKNLSKYSTKRKAYEARNEKSSPIGDQELLESWALDLVKIVGKFGRNLNRNPESIHKLVPPFCPQNSSIYQLFGKMEAKSLMVSGLSTENWDDSLARMSLGFGTRSSSISAAGSHIAVLASPGSVFIYDSSIFEESAVSPFIHGERVYRMELNSAATMVATYGYRTLKIWEISTGKCKMSVETIRSRPKPLTMLFVKNSTGLLIGFEDRRIRSLDLTQPSPTWQLVAELEEEELEGHFMNSSSYMALNRDGSLIAVAYRGHPFSAWETDGPSLLGHCSPKRETVSRGEVREAVWQPHTPEILGLYIEGVVFKWRPYDNEIEEIATDATRLAMSRDGILFTTGDGHGTVKVYTTSGFSLLYQLASQDIVLGLTFSPDLRRFYDIRGYYANAWEPNALMRFAEYSGKDTDNESDTDSFGQSSTAHMSRCMSIDAITALACSPSGAYYCCGTEKGTVRLHSAQGVKISDLYASEGFVSIDQVTWSHDGRYIAFSDSDEGVVIMSITPCAGNANPTLETAARIEIEDIRQGGILQLLFHPDSSQLLVHSASTTHTISLASKNVTHSLESPKNPRRWITHPHDPSLIIGFGPKDIRVLDWTLAERYKYTFEHSFSQSLPSEPASASEHAIVDRVLLAYDKKHILAQVSSSSQGSQEKTFLLFKTSSFSTSTTATPEIEQERNSTIITPTILPLDVSNQIALVLSFLSQDRLVFLSRSFSICSWQLKSLSNSLASLNLSARSSSVATSSSTGLINKPDTNTFSGKIFNELFSLPGDWISRDCLILCTVWVIERSFLCPRNGEIAVVKCAALI